MLREMTAKSLTSTIVVADEAVNAHVTLAKEAALLMEKTLDTAHTATEETV
jgi:hypothetical protein